MIKEAVVDLGMEKMAKNDLKVSNKYKKFSNFLGPGKLTSKVDPRLSKPEDKIGFNHTGALKGGAYDGRDTYSFEGENYRSAKRKAKKNIKRSAGVGVGLGTLLGGTIGVGEGNTTKEKILKGLGGAGMGALTGGIAGHTASSYRGKKKVLNSLNNEQRKNIKKLLESRNKTVGKRPGAAHEATNTYVSYVPY